MPRKHKSLMVQMTPRGKGRPRFARKTGVAYTPAETREAEATIRGAWQAYHGPEMETAVPRSLTIEATYKMPSSWSETKKAKFHGELCHRKHDADNVLKLVADALNGLAYRDDRQIPDERAIKLWGDESSIAVDIEYEEEAESHE